MATEVDPDIDEIEDEYEEIEDFRSMSRASIASIVFLVLGLTGFFVPAMLGLLLFGIVAGLLGYISAIRYPDEMSGAKLGLISMGACALLFCALTSYHVYIYYTEVPEGYSRVTWADLQPSREERKARQPISRKAIEMNGKLTFMKGYVMQPNGGRKHDLTQFILVRDIGACCFGDADPKPTHIIKVDLPKGQTVDWSMRVRSLTGTFHVQPSEQLGLKLYYQLEADQLLK